MIIEPLPLPYDLPPDDVIKWSSFNNPLPAETPQEQQETREATIEQIQSGILLHNPQTGQLSVNDKFRVGMNRPQPKIIMAGNEKKVDRNGPCPCGSNKKYKKCCGK